MNCFIESDNKIALLGTPVERQMITSATGSGLPVGILFYQAWKNNTSLLFLFPSMPIRFFSLGWRVLFQIFHPLLFRFSTLCRGVLVEIFHPLLFAVEFWFRFFKRCSSVFSSSSVGFWFRFFNLCSSVFSSSSVEFWFRFSPLCSSVFSPSAVDFWLRLFTLCLSVFSPFAVDFWLFGMKNVYRKGKVHPQTFPDAYSVLRLLPVAVATLSAALPAEDQEVLAYLIARSPDVLPLKENKRNSLPLSSMAEKASQQSPWSHRPSFECSCFQCYTSFWSRWDASPNRQTIHEAIDLYEEHMAAAARADAAKGNSKGKNRKGFKDKNPSPSPCADESISASASNDRPGVSVVQTEPEEALKKVQDLDLKQVVPAEEDEGLKEEEECSGRGRDTSPAPPPLTIGGRGIMRRVFPNIMSFIADHLWTAWTSPTGPDQQL